MNIVQMSQNVRVRHTSCSKMTKKDAVVSASVRINQLNLFVVIRRVEFFRSALCAKKWNNALVHVGWKAKAVEEFQFSIFAEDGDPMLTTII